MEKPWREWLHRQEKVLNLDTPNEALHKNSNRRFDGTTTTRMATHTGSGSERDTPSEVLQQQKFEQTVWWKNLNQNGRLHWLDRKWFWTWTRPIKHYKKIEQTVWWKNHHENGRLHWLDRKWFWTWTRPVKHYTKIRTNVLMEKPWRERQATLTRQEAVLNVDTATIPRPSPFLIPAIIRFHKRSRAANQGWRIPRRVSRRSRKS